jgi:hypothetical protein
MKIMLFDFQQVASSPHGTKLNAGINMAMFGFFLYGTRFRGVFCSRII